MIAGTSLLVPLSSGDNTRNTEACVICMSNNKSINVIIKWVWLILFVQKTIVTIHKSFPEIRKRLGNNSKQLQKTKSKDQLNKVIYYYLQLSYIVHCMQKSKPTFRLFRSQQQHNEVLQNSDHDNDDDVTTDDYTDCC